MKKFKCIRSDAEYLTIGKIYDCYSMRDGGITVINDKGYKFSYFLSRFEEVKEDKIVLLYKDQYVLHHNDRIYMVDIEPNETFIRVKTDKQHTEFMICWGDNYKTTLKDVQPILDVLNIEVVEEQPKKYKLVEQEYDEETANKLKELGLILEEIK